MTYFVPGTKIFLKDVFVLSVSGLMHIFITFTLDVQKGSWRSLIFFYFFVRVRLREERELHNIIIIYVQFCVKNGSDIPDEKAKKKLKIFGDAPKGDAHFRLVKERRKH